MRYSRDPTVLAPHKISLWYTRLCVLGWDIDTVAMTISGPLEKLERLRDMLHEWFPDRVVVFQNCPEGNILRYIFEKMAKMYFIEGRF